MIHSEQHCKNISHSTLEQSIQFHAHGKWNKVKIENRKKTWAFYIMHIMELCKVYAQMSWLAKSTDNGNVGWKFLGTLHWISATQQCCIISNFGCRKCRCRKIIWIKRERDRERRIYSSEIVKILWKCTYDSRFELDAKT